MPGNQVLVGGLFLTDGYQTTISFSGGGFDLGVIFLEKEVQPPALNGGGGIEVTTMRNQVVRTKAHKNLYQLDDLTLQVSYAPESYEAIAGIININGLWTVNFPDGSLLSFFAWLDTFTPAALKEGEFPLAEIKVIVSNINENGIESVYTFESAT